MLKTGKWAVIIFFIAVSLSACAGMKDRDADIFITDAKTAIGVDDKYKPVDATRTFPEGTTKVFCCFSWKDARRGIKIVAKWHYVTDDIHILDYVFAIPRKEGSGGVSLAMPDGKVLPPGLYRVTLGTDDRELKLIMFKVLEKK